MQRKDKCTEVENDAKANSQKLFEEANEPRGRLYFHAKTTDGERQYW